MTSIIITAPLDKIEVADQITEELGFGTGNFIQVWPEQGPSSHSYCCFQTNEKPTAKADYDIVDCDSEVSPKSLVDPTRVVVFHSDTMWGATHWSFVQGLYGVDEGISP